jgi:hypothetical protein
MKIKNYIFRTFKLNISFLKFKIILNYRIKELKIKKKKIKDKR